MSFVFACACVGLAGCEPRDHTGAEPAPAEESAAEQRPVVLFLGTSLTAGYGLTADEAFPGLLQRRIDERGLRYRVVNAGVSGDTSAGGLARLDWLLRLPIAVLVLELGANDMLRGLDVVAMRTNLQEILVKIHAAHPRSRLVVAGMRAAPNLGAVYGRAFDATYPAIARDSDALLIPFLLEGVAGDPALNQRDGMHPNAPGHRRIAETVWKVLAPALQGASSRPAAASAPGPKP